MNTRKIGIVVSVLLVVAGIAGIASVPMAWYGEWIQRNLFPQEFWEAKVKEHEESVRRYRGEVRSCQLDAEKQQRAANIERTLSRLAGVSPATVNKELAQVYQLISDVCRIYNELLRKEQVALKVALSELERVGGREAESLSYGTMAPTTTLALQSRQ